MNKFTEIIAQLGVVRNALHIIKGQADEDVLNIAAKHTDNPVKVLDGTMDTIDRIAADLRVEAMKSSTSFENSLFLTSMGLDLTFDHWRAPSIVLENELMKTTFTYSNSVLANVAIANYGHTTEVFRPYGIIEYRQPLFDFFTTDEFYNKLANTTREIYKSIIGCMTDGDKDNVLNKLYNDTGMKITASLAADPRMNNILSFHSITLNPGTDKEIVYNIRGSVFYSYVRNHIYPDLKKRGILHDA